MRYTTFIPLPLLQYHGYCISKFIAIPCLLLAPPTRSCKSSVFTLRARVVLHCVAVCCSVSADSTCACVVCCRVLQSVAECCRVLQSAAECCRVLQSAAECCRVLQSVAECGRVLQMVCGLSRRIRRDLYSHRCLQCVVHCSTLFKCVADLHCFAVCCSVSADSTCTVAVFCSVLYAHLLALCPRALLRFMFSFSCCTRSLLPPSLPFSLSFAVS